MILFKHKTLGSLWYIEMGCRMGIPTDVVNYYKRSQRFRLTAGGKYSLKNLVAVAEI